MSRRMPMTPMTSPAGPRRAEALRVVGMTSPEALRGLSRTLRVTPRATTSPRATMSSRASSRLTKRESDCSRTSSLRNPSSSETASFASRILPSRLDTKTGSGALAMMRLASRFFIARSGPSAFAAAAPTLGTRWWSEKGCRRSTDSGAWWRARNRGEQTRRHRLWQAGPRPGLGARHERVVTLWCARRRLSPPGAVEAAVLDGFRAVLGRDRGDASQVGDRACHPQRPIVTTGRETEPRHGRTHETGAFGSERAEAPEQTRAHLGVDAQAGPVEPVTLPLAREQHAGANRRRADPGAAPLELGGPEGRQLHLQVDPVQQGAGQAPEITVALGRRAEAPLERRATAAAGIGGRHEKEAGGEVADAGGPRDGDAPVLERLAQ